MEILRQRGVRLIAVMTAWIVPKSDDDFTPFPQHYSERILRQNAAVKSVPLSSQKQVRQAPHRHGHLRLSLGKPETNGWLTPKPTDVVEAHLCHLIEGYGQYQIAAKLKEEKILIPSAYLAHTARGVNKNRLSKMRGWGLPPSATFLKA